MNNFFQFNKNFYNRRDFYSPNEAYQFVIDASSINFILNNKEFTLIFKDIK